MRRLGYVACREGNLDDADQYFYESLDLNRQVGHLQGMAACMAGLGSVYLARRQLERAAVIYGWVNSVLKRVRGPVLLHRHT